MKKIGFELKDEIEVDESQELTLGEVESYMAESQDAFETV